MPILMYHRIADNGPEGLLRWRVPEPEFVRQVEWLAAEGYTSIRLDEWVTVQRRDPAALAQRVVLTFDDAYKDFVTAAFPILQRCGFGATMFVPDNSDGIRAVVRHLDVLAAVPDEVAITEISDAPIA